MDGILPKQRVLFIKMTSKDLRYVLSITDLPGVIRDASEVAIELGYQYFSRLRREDWVNQAARMAQIYAQSDLILSASYAADEDATMFPRKGPVGAASSHYVCSQPGCCQKSSLRCQNSQIMRIKRHELHIRSLLMANDLDHMTRCTVGWDGLQVEARSSKSAPSHGE